MTQTLVPLLWLAMVVSAARHFRPQPQARRLGPTPSVPERSDRGRTELRAGRRRAVPFGSRRRATHEAGVADLIDLFAVAVGSGLNVRLAVEAVARRSVPGPLADELRSVCRDVAAGRRLADRLEEMTERLRLAALRPLIAALVDAERYGSALGPSLERLAHEARRTRQRWAEEAARRIPVKLLFPLVTCVLPAFVLLTVAPFIAGGLRAVRLSP